MRNLLFPSLKDGRWGYLNLGEESRALPSDDNHLLDPSKCAEWVESLHHRNGIDFSYGGYMEDRSHLWRGHYMKPGYTWHLGIDFNIPAGTVVCLPERCVLERSVMDADRNGGWGGQLVFRIFGVDNYFLVLGHLADIVSEEKIYEAGAPVGQIAAAPFNGNWHPHLHVQACRNRPDAQLDGYSKLYDGVENDFPRPDVDSGQGDLRVACIE